MDQKCIGVAGPVIDATRASHRSYIRTNTYVIIAKNALYCRMPWAVPRARKLLQRDRSAGGARMETINTVPGLKAGDWVEIKTEDEIKATLDKSNKTRGLRFMDEMWMYCGKRYRVFKQVEKIKIEETGELRIVRSPTYFLEGVYCNGAFHDGCDKCCFLFWKEDWMRKVDDIKP